MLKPTQNRERYPRKSRKSWKKTTVRLAFAKKAKSFISHLNGIETTGLDLLELMGKHREILHDLTPEFCRKVRESAEMINRLNSQINPSPNTALPPPAAAPIPDKYKIDRSKIAGLMGGVKVALDFTPQEFKMLNQAVNPACTDNEEKVYLAQQ